MALQQKSGFGRFFVGYDYAIPGLAGLPETYISKIIDTHQGRMGWLISTMRTLESIVGCPRLSKTKE
jgi:hypothetical protein